MRDRQRLWWLLPRTISSRLLLEGRRDRRQAYPGVAGGVHGRVGIAQAGRDAELLGVVDGTVEAVGVTLAAVDALAAEVAVEHGLPEKGEHSAHAHRHNRQQHPWAATSRLATPAARILLAAPYTRATAVEHCRARRSRGREQRKPEEYRRASAADSAPPIVAQWRTLSR